MTGHGTGADSAATTAIAMTVTEPGGPLIPRPVEVARPPRG